MEEHHISRSVNEVLFEAVKNKLQTARESYAVYRSTMEDLNQLLKDMVDYAVKNNWNLQEPSDYSFEGYLYDGKPEIDEVMEKIIEMFGVPEGEL
uniref:Uncharacterized protein n=1 Tax=Siphoviridae sp. ctbgC51 TaxID=2827901 RepID=A0A8S5TEU2_9CAUD|nr:MAG TPA: hypothetical protein [Siphoviridae sp. ctbgC51]